MINHLWTVVCQHVVIDSQSNNVSLQNVLEQIAVAEEPVPNGLLPVKFEIISLWIRSDLDTPTSGHSRIVFAFPSGKRATVGPEMTIDLSNHSRARTVLRVQGFPIQELGQHIFLVELQDEAETEWHEVAAIPVEVIHSELN